MDHGHLWRTDGCDGGGAQDNSIINRIMLRFRPIAPKPAAGELGSGTVSADRRNVLLSVARKKRKYTRVRKRNGNGNGNGSKIRKNRSEEERNDPVVTLQLLPEKTDSNDTVEARFLRDLNKAIIAEPIPENRQPPGCLTGMTVLSVKDPATVTPPRRAVESSVTVERVTDTCMDGRGLGRTDVERLENLERDTCPGFISDGWDRVQWVNPAYRKLVAGEGQYSPEIAVWLVMKEKLPNLYPSFTCRVKLQYTWQDEKESKTKTVTVPSDVWRMDSGGLAWRLDLKAALSLGL